MSNRLTRKLPYVSLALLFVASWVITVDLTIGAAIAESITAAVTAALFVTPEEVEQIDKIPFW